MMHVQMKILMMKKLVLNEALLERAMRSRIGGRCIEGENDVTELINGKTSHEENSKSAMELATKMWPETNVRHCKESISADVDSASVKGILAAAKASQQRDKRGGPVLEDAEKQLYLCNILRQ